MRTTLTLADDVAAQLEHIRTQRNVTFKELVNDVLRAGLAHMDRADEPDGGPYTAVVTLGRLRLPDLDDVSEALAVAEGDNYR